MLRSSEALGKTAAVGAVLSVRVVNCGKERRKFKEETFIFKIIIK